MVVQNKKQKVPGCRPKGKHRGKNMCYDPDPDPFPIPAQENGKLGECAIGCTNKHDCDVRIKESSIDVLDHSVANVSHSLADWYEVYESRKEKESVGSRLRYDKERKGKELVLSC
jgi:hypothetical protein